MYLKQLVLYIVLFSLGIAATAAPVRYCKKAGKALAVLAIVIPSSAPQEKEKTPAQNNEVCSSTTLVFHFSPQHGVRSQPIFKLLHLEDYRSPFYPQYIANPPFAPPRAFFV